MNRRNLPWLRLISQVLGLVLTIVGFFNNVPVATTLLVAFAFVMGPVFCGWVCPFGFLQDLASRLGSRLKIRKVRVPRFLHLVLIWLRYVLLAFLLLSTADFIFTLLSHDPRANLAQFLTGSGWAVAGWVVIGVFAAAAIFIERPFCNYLCVEGAKLGLFGALRPVTIVRSEDTCVNCRKCDKVCPMNISISDKPQVRSLQCIDCMNCVASCPVRNTLRVQPAATMKPLGLFVLTLLIAGSVTGFAWVAAHGNDLVVPTPDEVGSTLSSMLNAEASAASGEYDGSTSDSSASDAASNETSDASVREDGSVSSAASSDASTDAGQTTDGLTSESAGTTDAASASSDSSSGTSESATSESAASAAASSSATAAATKATTGKTTATTKSAAGTTAATTAATTSAAPTTAATTAPATAATTAATTAAPTTAATTQATTAATGNAAGIPDGTYTGSGKGFKGTITVKVTVSNQTITKITLVSDSDDRKWFDRAWSTIVSRILSAQSPDVDSVSGATYSSYGIKLAVQDALQNAGGSNIDSVSR